jgi:hypothetical protein
MNATVNVCMFIGLILGGMAVLEYFRWRRSALGGTGDSYPASRLICRVASVLLLEGVLALVVYNDALSRTPGDALRQFQTLCAAIVLALVALMIAIREIRGERRRALGDAGSAADEIARRMMEELKREGIIGQSGGKPPAGQEDGGAKK